MPPPAAVRTCVLALPALLAIALLGAEAVPPESSAQISSPIEAESDLSQENESLRAAFAATEAENKELRQGMDAEILGGVNTNQIRNNEKWTFNAFSNCCLAGR